MKQVSFAVLAITVGLWGCATSDTPKDATSADTPSSSSSSSSQTAGRSGSPLTGTAVPPVRAGADRPDLKRSVYYEFDKYDVKPEYRALVDTHARWLKANPQARLTIEGNADERGSREYNVALGQRRAESVTKMLTLLGARPEQIEAVSWGKEKPRDEGHDEKAWQENRRADFAPPRK